ncbi:MAG: phosphopyruvate hydratase, partial [Candidatus Roizmanbacteria bacterium]
TYSILVLEDPLAEDEFANWKKLNETVSESTYLAGDDLVSGNKSRLDKALSENLCSAVVIKSNQYATLTEFMDTFALVSSKNIKTIISQRFGETTDDLIADVAVGLQANFVKFGSTNRGERVVKYNRLLEIEQEMAV